MGSRYLVQRRVPTPPCAASADRLGADAAPTRVVTPLARRCSRTECALSDFLMMSAPWHFRTSPLRRMSASRQQPPFANRMLFSAKATWAKDSHELRSPSLHHPISAQSSLLTDDYGGDSEALISDMTEQCRHSCCDHYPLVRNRRRCPEDKWLLDMKRGHQVLFLRLFTKKLVSDPMTARDDSFRGLVSVAAPTGP